ncbi:hypothetical protein M427DRAFT_379872 [Gonapodya prolifera JEL478]|uniref:Uncharacterized protein n=1 Tax=Gonapodya prolifera (strain JEL478) TaxID=1344416 RepID=A0A139AVA1_GONPJ|nr:hypothetical protein M427DRAFT_379872 [Gonapodya prolifera JEL478]|eukprot:KXS20637.1 hypothetical protein M427DRAFT_379872 [Gonapodya prolifera JEL478]
MPLFSISPNVPFLNVSDTNPHHLPPLTMIIVLITLSLRCRAVNVSNLHSEVPFHPVAISKVHLHCTRRIVRGTAHLLCRHFSESCHRRPAQKVADSGGGIDKQRVASLGICRYGTRIKVHVQDDGGGGRCGRSSTARSSPGSRPGGSTWTIRQSTTVVPFSFLTRLCRGSRQGC